MAKLILLTSIWTTSTYDSHMASMAPGKDTVERTALSTKTRLTLVAMSTSMLGDYAMNYWKVNGPPAEKLIVGLPTYGHTFILSNPSNTAVGAPTSGPEPAGPDTRQSGFWAYYEICTFLKNRATQAWDTPQDVPYAYKGNEWLGYDNIKSFNIKAQWLMKNNFGGAMVWSLNLDDFTGTFYNQGKFPLINTLKNALGPQSTSCTAPAQPISPITEASSSGSGSGNSGSNPRSGSGSSSSSSGGTGFCASMASGLFPDPSNSNSFYHCMNGKTYLQKLPRWPGLRLQLLLLQLGMNRSGYDN
ncbi:unnamed protein product [Caretta caretta]